MLLRSRDLFFFSTYKKSDESLAPKAHRATHDYSRFNCIYKYKNENIKTQEDFGILKSLEKNIPEYYI